MSQSIINVEDRAVNKAGEDPDGKVRVRETRRT